MIDVQSHIIHWSTNTAWITLFFLTCLVLELSACRVGTAEKDRERGALGQESRQKVHGEERAAHRL